MSLLRRRTVLRRFFAALERIASNVGLIREAGKEFRLFSAEEVTLVRQLAESRQRLQDLRAQRDEEARQVHSILARQVKEAVTAVEARQEALLAQQDALLGLCTQLLRERQMLTAALAQLPPERNGAGSSSGGSSSSSGGGGSSGNGSDGGSGSGIPARNGSGLAEGADAATPAPSENLAAAGEGAIRAALERDMGPAQPCSSRQP